MSQDLKGLLSAIKLVADAAKDTLEVVATNSSAVMSILLYKNLIGDLVTLVPLLSDIPTEVKSLSSEDYLFLVQSLVDDLSISDVHAKSIIDGSMDLFKELVTATLPKIQGLVSIIKTPPAAPTIPVAS